MTIRVTYRKKDGIINTMHYYNIGHIWIDHDDNGILNITLTTITGHILEKIALNDEIESAMMEDNCYFYGV